MYKVRTARELPISPGFLCLYLFKENWTRLTLIEAYTERNDTPSEKRIKCIEEGRSFLHIGAILPWSQRSLCVTHAGGGPLTVTAKLTGP
jgi:hypothetical protein